MLSSQGTAATALAGLVGAMRVLGKPARALCEQRVLCVGAGSAGMGVVRMIAAGEIQQLEDGQHTHAVVPADHEPDSDPQFIHVSTVEPDIGPAMLRSQHSLHPCVCCVSCCCQVWRSKVP